MRWLEACPDDDDLHVICQLKNPCYPTVCTGDQRSAAASYPIGSSPGLCKIEMQTLPSGYTAKGKRTVQVSNSSEGPRRRRQAQTLAIWVPHLRQEPAGGRTVRVVLGEGKPSIEEATLTAIQANLSS
jgi:hypothetical protein